MAAMVKRDEKLLRLLSNGSESAVDKLCEFADFKEVFDTFIKDYGHREVTFDYYKPTWADAPWVVLDLIYLTATTENIEEPNKKESEAKAASFEAVQEIISKTPKELKYFISQLIQLTITYTNLDDLEHFHTTRVNVLARRAAEAFGERLVQRGQLEDKLDIFFLVKEELELISQFKLSKELKRNIKDRKEKYLQACKTEPMWDLNEAEDESEVSDDVNSFKGIPGSPGECEGKIYLVHGPEDFAGMPENAIIVARTTNPAWTPLFYKAKGLITESGGPLSHGAVTARELGLPAVMCVRNALRVFENGQEVKIDGQKGIVVVK
jgi:pyruvate,water dikinase